MATRIIYDQTQPATANGEATGWIKVLDVTQLVAGCTGFIYDHDTGPVAIRVEAIDSPGSKLQLSRLDDSGSYIVSSLVAYTVTSGTAVKIPQQAREDAGYVPPGAGAIAGIAALGSTVGSGFVTFANSNGVTFGLSNNVMTASVQTSGGAGGVALSAGLYSTNSGTVVFSNANGMSFGMDTNGAITGEYYLPPTAGKSFVNSNNVSFGYLGTGTQLVSVTATATFEQTVQTQGLVNIQGSTGTINFSNANGISFGGSNNTITASVVIPDQTVQTQNLVSIKGSTGNIFFDNANGLTFGGTNNTITASYTVPVVPAQTVQPVAASLSNGSFAFSTLGFNNGGGVSFSSDVNGINAQVKTDYQSSNANYLTSQSNQAVSGTNGSFTFQTLSLGASNGVTFYTTDGSVVASYTVPNVPAQTYQPGAYSGSNGSFTASTLSFGVSNNVTFYTTNGSLVASIPLQNPNINISAGTTSTLDTHFAFVNANNVSFGLATLNNEITASATWPAQTVQPVAISGSNGSSLFSTLTMGNSNGLTHYMTNGSLVGSYTVPGATVFSNSNNVTFGLNGSTVTASVTVTYPAQTVQPVAASASNGSFNFSTLGFVQGSGVTWATQVGGIQASVKTDYQSSNANYLTSQSNQAFSASGGSSAFQTLNFANSNNVTFSNSGGSVVASASYPAQTAQPVAASASNGSFNFSTLGFVQGSGVTWATQVGGIQASVKTDYQSSNANYLTSQSNQAFSASGGSSAFQTLNFANSNGVTFTNTGGSVAISYTVPGATVFSNSNNVSFGLNGSTVTASASFTAQTVQPVAASASNGSYNFSTLKFVEGSGVTWATQANGIQASVKTDYQSSNANYLTSQSTGPSAIAVPGTTLTSGPIIFSNSNGVSFGYGTGTASNIITVTVQPGAAAGIAAINAGSEQATSGTVTFANSNGVTFGMGSGGNYGVITASIQAAAASGVGAIIAGTQTVSSGSVTFSNSNNVSFGLGSGASASILTASASFAQSIQPGAVSGSNGSFTYSTLTLGSSNGMHFYTTNGSIVGSYTQQALPGATVFSNSNNVTFGLNGSTVTASASFTAQTVQPVAASGSNGSFAFSTLSFGQSNGATFYTTNNSVVVSYTVPAVPGATVFSNSNNVSFGLNGSTVTASASFTAQTVQPVAASASNGSYNFSTLKFVEGSGVTWATQANGIQASVKTDYQSSNANYLTSQTNQTIGLYASGNQTGTTVSSLDARSFTVFGAGNVSVGFSGGQLYVSATGGGGGGAAVGISTAGNTQGTSGNFSNGTYIFEGSNGLSVSQLTAATPGVQTLRLVAPSQTVQPVAISGSNGSSLFSTLSLGSSAGLNLYLSNGSVVGTYTVPGATVFSNSNNVTFGLNGSTVTASVTVTYPAQTVQPVAASGSNGSFAFSTLTFGSSNGVHFYTTNNSLVGSYAHSGPTGVVVNASASTLTNGNLVFSNSNNISFGINGSTITAVASESFSASNGSYSSGVLKFVEGSGVTWATQANGIQASVKTAYIEGIAVTGSTVGNGTIAFANGNVTFGMAGSVITASANAGAVNQTGPNIAAEGANAATVTNGTVVFSNSNGVSFGLGAGANSTIMTASMAGDKTDSQWPLVPPGMFSSSLYTGASGNTGGSTQWTVSGYMGPIVLENALHYSDFEYYISATNGTGTGSMSIGHQFGIYSLNAGTALSLITSFCWQASMSQNNVTAQTWHQYRHTNSSTYSTAANGNISASYTGIRQLVCHTGSQSLNSGTYAIAHIYTARSAGSLVLPAGTGFYSMNGSTNATLAYSTGAARMGTNTTEPMMFKNFIGVFSTTTNQSTLMLPIMPGSIHTSNFTNTGGASQWRHPVPIMYL